MTATRTRPLARLWLWLALLLTGAVLAMASSIDTGFGETGLGRSAVTLTIEGPIGPATSDYIVRGIDKAAEQDAALVILRMDTPGGLDTAMREIIRAILASPVPVVSFVAPSGARAASAGTYISYAAHVAAMAPGTNLGAATPVQVGGAPGMPGGDEESPNDPGGSPDAGPSPDEETDAKPEGEAGDDAEAEPDSKPAGQAGMKEKMVNDAVAYIRSLAQLRGRNVEWAEKAVTEAASLSAEDALEKNVIDLIAADIPALLAKLDGRTVTIDDEPVTLATKDLRIETVDPDWRTKLLAVITNPNVASLLMLIGVYGLILEFYSPGLVGPGVIGAICLMMALYAFNVLPVDYAGVGLMLLGIGLMIAEMFLPSFGIIGLGGVVAFVLGTIMLIDTDAPGYQVSWGMVGGIGLALGGGIVLLALTLMRSRREAVVSGPEQMIGSEAVVVDWRGSAGTVRAHGETWRARAAAALAPGTRARVTGLDGLTLEVAPDADSPRGNAKEE